MSAENEMMAEPDWLAAEPTAQRKVTAIFAAVRRYYAASRTPSERGQPCLGLTTAELFIGQLLLKAAADEREACAQLAEQMGAGCYTAALRRQVAELVHERDDLRSLLAGLQLGYDLMDGACKATTAERDELRQQVAQAATAERERIRQLAIGYGARYASVGGSSIADYPFADLLAGETP
jgi:hypothetical protein